jgi:Flp pilus assembly protein TadD
MSKVLLLAVIVFAGLLPARAQDQWVEVKSAHFNILSNGAGQSNRELATQFEQMRSVFDQLFFREQVDQAVPLQVIALKSNRQLSEYAPLYQGKPVNIVGFYLRSQDKDFIVLDLEARNHWETVFHEYAHMLLDINFPDVPVWFSEGFAQFCSTIRISGKTAVLGHAPEAAAGVLKNRALLPAAVLLNVDHDSPIYNEDQEDRSIYYAQAWLAVHYFWENHKMDQVRNYMELTRKRVPVMDALKQALEMNAAELDSALARYARSEVESVPIQLPAHLEHVVVSEHSVPALEAEATLADLHAHQDDHRQQSIAEFQKILDREPGNTTAERGLGYALFTQQHLGRALPHLKKAAAQNPRDWMVHYYLASAMAQTHDDPYAPEIEKESRMVTQLNPALADGYGLLGFALMTERKIAEAVEAYETALRLKPASEPYALNLAELYSMQGKLDQAKELFAYLQNSQNSTISGAARSHLELMAGPKKSN